ncbi:SE1561 family protein [Terribacillus sp. DMT04]|uniref:SE1561 family protein n=1 Tax=Terribacillus sp. DMT04 TaxID=2850441 RepID=UPI0020B6E5A6|nr:SE1561 family protein [Terribacillus sp. DMT04]
MTIPTHKVDDLKQRLAAFMDYLDNIEPEQTSLDEIDEMLRMLDDMENRFK